MVGSPQRLVPDHMMDCTNEIEVCTRLLGGELAAAATYARAIEYLRGEAAAPILEAIQVEHLDSAEQLRERVRALGVPPAPIPPVWSALVAAVERKSRLFGDDSPLLALLNGEELDRVVGVQALVDNGGLPEDVRQLISSTLLPRRLRHISTLRELIKGR